VEVPTRGGILRTLQQLAVQSRAAKSQKEKHMIIGNFKQHGDVYAGSLYGMALNVAYVTLSPVPAKQGNGPDFVVLGAPSEEDRGSELGAAWAKTSKAGKPYLSVKLDGPTLAQPINCALTKQQDGSHALVWNRKDAKADEQPAAEEAAA
jgi:uncharacterized protein (DUF736 family)